MKKKDPWKGELGKTYKKFFVVVKKIHILSNNYLL